MVYLPFLLQYNLLKFSVNKTESRYYRPSGVIGIVPLLCVFCFNFMSTLDGKVFRVHFMQARLSPQCTPTGLSHSLHAHAATKPFVGSRNICSKGGEYIGDTG